MTIPTATVKQRGGHETSSEKDTLWFYPERTGDRLHGKRKRVWPEDNPQLEVHQVVDGVALVMNADEWWSWIGLARLDVKE